MISWKLFQLTFKKLSDVVSKEVDQRTKYTKRNTKVGDLKDENSDAFTLIHINQYNTDKKSSKKNTEDPDKRIHDTSKLVTNNVLNTKTGEIENKIGDVSGTVTTTFLDSKVGEVEKKYLTMINILLLMILII